MKPAGHALSSDRLLARPAVPLPRPAAYRHTRSVSLAGRPAEETARQSDVTLAPEATCLVRFAQQPGQPPGPSANVGAWGVQKAAMRVIHLPTNVRAELDDLRVSMQLADARVGRPYWALCAVTSRGLPGRASRNVAIAACRPGRRSRRDDRLLASAACSPSPAVLPCRRPGGWRERAQPG